MNNIDTNLCVHVADCFVSSISTFFLHKQKQRVDTLLIYTEEPYELAQPGTLNALYILSLVRLASDC